MNFARSLLISGFALGALACLGCGGGSGTSTEPADPSITPPVASFTATPVAVVTTQTVAFTDASTGTPTSWAWNFGDSATSEAQNPVHAYSAPGTYTVTLVASNAGGSTTATQSVAVTQAQSGSLLNIILGRPTSSSIAVSILPSVQIDGSAASLESFFIEYGTASGGFSGKTADTSFSTGTEEPTVAELTGLEANTRYYYRTFFKVQGETDYRAETEHSFNTQRVSGSTFSFGVQGDSHPERVSSMFNSGLYTLNMQNVAERQPDFYFALGDDFNTDELLRSNTTADQVAQNVTYSTVSEKYLTQRGWFGVMANSTPLYLVNGNHENAGGYLLTDAYSSSIYTSVPALVGKSRVTYYPLPATDGFYSADTTEVAGVGLLRDYYAWEWGDALFVTIDPYWHSPVPANTAVPDVTAPTDQWEVTMGDEQYAWLKNVLESSSAKYKFVFAHHVNGGGRGGAAIAGTYEWGGYTGGKKYEFTSNRSWAKPIHQLMNDAGVTVFFFGHDHVFAREKVDDVVYQSVQNPADNTYTAFNSDAFAPATISFPGATYDSSYGVVMSNSGYLHVTVSPENVTVDYVRAVLPGDESLVGGVSNGETAFSYSVTAH